ncbi:T9SS type A sorting domain-containing protein [candidate division KSB1 bacterium]|nr:T9SS type A sorting domain-containing protein [candidate division KSB1 bacterium]
MKPYVYTYVDNDVENNQYFYRLKQIDKDGSYKYSIICSTSGNGPQIFILSQNFPNPFNSSTTIEYKVPKNCNVNIQIYNLVGQKIKTLVNTQKEKGEYKIYWDGTDDLGENISTGVYFYKINSGAFHNVKKLLLIR